MLTLEQLKEHGYAFEISGRKYAVYHEAPPKIVSWADDQIDALLFSAFSKNPTPINIPARKGLSVFWSTIFDEFHSVRPRRLIIRGTFDPTYQNKKRQFTYPRHVDLKKVTEFCIEAANRDFVLQKLTS